MTNYTSIRYIFSFLIVLCTYQLALSQCTFTDPQKQAEYDFIVDLVDANINNVSLEFILIKQNCDVCQYSVAVECNEQGYITELNLDDTGTPNLPESVGDLIYLEEFTYINDDNTATFYERITELLNLRRLTFRSDFTALPENFGNLTNLEYFNFRSDSISELPLSIGNLTNLKTLFIRGSQIDFIPDTVYTLSALELLLINNTNITSVPPEVTSMPNLRRLNISYNNIECLPETFTDFCETDISISIFPENPIGITYEEFCENPTSYFCSAPSIACGELTVIPTDSIIYINGHPDENYQKMELIDITNGGYDVSIICEGDCENNEQTGILADGEYLVKVFNENWTVGCKLDYNEPIIIDNSGLTEEEANCDVLTFTASDEGTVTIGNISAGNTQIDYIGANTNWQIVNHCDGDCGNSTTIDGLADGNYSIKVQEFGDDGSYCYREEEVILNGGIPTGGAADCAALNIATSEDQVTITGLNAQRNLVEYIGANTNWQLVTVCDGNCAATEIISGLATGAYEIKVQQFGDDGSYCKEREMVNISSSATLRMEKNSNGGVEQSIQLYPNPLRGQELNVITGSLSGKQVEINLVDIVGKTVRSYQIDELPEQLSLSVPTMERGLYFLNIIAEDGGVVTKRFVVGEL